MRPNANHKTGGMSRRMGGMPNPYGRAHRRLRVALIARALLEGWHCPKCGLPILEGQPLDLGHASQEEKRRGLPGRQVEHRACNRSHDPVVPTTLTPSTLTPSTDRI